MRLRDLGRAAALGVALPLAAAPPAWAIAQVPGPIEIGPSWARSQPDGSMLLFTTIVNHGVLSDRLTGGRCAGWGDVSLAGLDPATQGGSADEKGLLIAPGSTASLHPDGARLALAPADHSGATLISCAISFVHSGQRLVVFRMGAPGPSIQIP